MKRKVLIGYAENGSGHKSAAQYIKNFFEDKNKFDIKVINLTEFYKSNNKLVSSIHNHAIKSDFLFSLFYGLSNNRIASKGNEKLCVKTFDSENLRNVFKEFNPDIVISTHFFVSYMASFYNKENIINSKIMTVITDFVYHEAWTANYSSVDYFIVRNEIVKNELISHNVPSEKIFALGNPANCKASIKLDDKDFVLKKYSLLGFKPIYLFFGGGSVGHDYTFEYFKAVVKKRHPIDIIFVSGKNKDLKIKCENFILKNDIKNVLVLGFTKDVFNLLNIADVVITKPGSSTLNECIEMKKPCILIPGVDVSEKYNAKFMTKNHYASKVKSPSGLSRKVRLSLDYPFIINSMRNRLNKISSDNSCKKIFDLVVNELSKKS
jgi:processive 1,2-diacylglycerol beta-glucosyltransferase